MDPQAKAAVLAIKEEARRREIRPEQIPASCVDERVRYVVQRNTVWYCGSCHEAINDDPENSIKCTCDFCLS